MKDELARELDRMKAAGQLRDLSDTRLLSHGKIEARGKTYHDFSNWDYFGLAADPRVKRAAQEELERSGFGVRSARASSGTSPLHARCETRFAEFVGAEAALMFSSRTQAIFTFITTFCNERDWIVVDESVQSPVLDACYLVNASSSVISIGDPTRLAIELERIQSARRKFVFVEGISQCSGESARILEIHQQCLRYGAVLVVDESAALAVMGNRGAGSVEAAGLTCSSDSLVVIADLSQGLASFGAMVASSALIINHLINRSRNLVHEIAMPSAVAASVIAVIDIIELMTAQRLLLLQSAKEFDDSLSIIEKRSSRQLESPILSVRFSSYPLALECCRALQARGIFAEAINLRLPLSELSVLRFIISISHTRNILELTLNHLNDILPRFLRKAG